MLDLSALSQLVPPSVEATPANPGSSAYPNCLDNRCPDFVGRGSTPSATPRAAGPSAPCPLLGFRLPKRVSRLLGSRKLGLGVDQRLDYVTVAALRSHL